MRNGRLPQHGFSFWLAGVWCALAVCASVFVSCEALADEETPATEWYVSLPASDGTVSSADWTQADVVRYVVTLMQGASAVMQKDGYPGERVMLNQLAPGEYDIAVEGYNDADEVIADGGGTVYLETGKIANVAITLTMRTNRHSYAVLYDTNAGDDDVMGDFPQRAAYNYHDEVTVAFPALTRTGYDFDGWNTQADGTGTAFRADGTTAFTVTTHDVTLYAQWIPYPYTVTFEGGADAAQGSMTAMNFVYGTAQALAKCNFTRAGYVFIGWSRDATVHENETTEASPVEFYDEETVKNLTTEKNGTVTLYAKWFAEILLNYRVEHYKQNLADNDYTLFETDTLQGYAMKRTEAAAKVYEGFHVLDFAQTRIIPTYDDDEVAVVQIYYDRDEYTVTYTASESGVTNLPAKKSYRYGTTVKVESDIPARTGYQFAGWTKDTDTASRYAYGDTIMHDEITDFIKADITMHARWTAITYKIHYSAGSTDRVSGTMADTEATYDQDISLRAIGFARDGYEFAGWATSEGGAKVYDDGASVKNLSAVQNAVVPLYARWERGTSAYTVEHYLQPVTGSAVLSDYALKDTDQKRGITGDNTAASANSYTGFSPQSFSQIPITNDGSAVVKIYYNRNPYTVTFAGNENTGGATATQTFCYGVEQNLATNGFTRTGYAFDGWATSATADALYANNGRYTIGAANTTLYATWKANQYAVTLNNQGADIAAGTESVTATYDAEMPIITPPQKTGYTFQGWYTQANGNGTPYYSASGESLRAWNIASDTTLYAKWTEATDTAYTVNHYWQNTTGNTQADYTLHETETLTGTTGNQTAATAKAYDGFTALTVTPAMQTTILADGSAVVSLYYTRKIFTVTYTTGADISSNVTGMPTEKSYRYDAAVTVASEEPTRSGYAFNGWHLGSDTTTVWKKGKEVSAGITENLTLTAVWSSVSGISVTVKNPQKATATQSADGTTVRLTLVPASETVTQLNETLTTIDGTAIGAFNAAHGNSVRIDGLTLICDTATWATGMYQICIAGADTSLGSVIPDNANITVIVP